MDLEIHYRPFNGRYILNGHTPEQCPDLIEWATWMGRGVRRVAEETIGDFWISTVFLGLDHNYGIGAPLLFETMIFDRDGSRQDWMTDRYSTWDEAEAGHKLAIEQLLRLELPPEKEREGLAGDEESVPDLSVSDRFQRQAPGSRISRQDPGASPDRR